MVYMERVIKGDGMKKQYDMHCNIAQTLNLIGDRWTLLILHAVREGRRTYKDVRGWASQLQPVSGASAALSV